MTRALTTLPLTRVTKKCLGCGYRNKVQDSILTEPGGGVSQTVRPCGLWSIPRNLMFDRALSKK